jgi:hypothetical protein
LDDLSKGKYKESLRLYRLDDLQITTKKTFYINAGILVFKNKKLQNRRQNDSGSLFRHQGIQRNNARQRGD